jgi:hypothetical protein
MNANDTVVDLSPVPIVLSTDTDGFPTALGRPGLVNTANSVRMRVFLDHNLLTAVSKLLLIPLDRFEKAL